MTDTVTLPREVAKRILRNIEIGNKLSAGIEMRREIEAALEQPQSPYGECDECGTPYSYDPTDGGCICVRCMKEKLATKQSQGEQGPNPRWPSNASEVRAFLSGRVATERYARDDHQPDDNDTYTLSAHDLLEAIDWWTDFDTQPRQPLTDEQIVSMWKFPRDLSWMDSVVRLARAVERAHGIGGEA